MKKIRMAFVHTTGLSAGGTEQFLQRLAVGLPKDRFEIDFYYANNTAEHRKKYVEENGVHTIKFACSQIIEKKGFGRAFGCDFDKVYKDDYDIVMLGTDGADISYLDCIRKTPIIDSIHYVSGVNNRFNVSRVMQISEFSRNLWKNKGGDDSRCVMISLPLKKPDFVYTDIRKALGLSPDTFIFGMHQANRDEIFSDIPLKAYKEVENEKNAYVLLNGSKRYREQAKELGLKNVYFYDYVNDNDQFYSILQSFDVYAHGRKDGELNSAALAEAMSLGLPIITHPSNYFNGHLEVIKDNGYVVKNYEEYAKKMMLLERDDSLRNKLGENSIKKFIEHYDYEGQMNNIIKIYEDVVRNPYPLRFRRYLYSIIQAIRNKVLYFYIGICELSGKKDKL